MFSYNLLIDVIDINDIDVNQKIVYVSSMRQLMLSLIKELDLHILNFQEHQHYPYGCSINCILKENYLNINTYPEMNAFGLDFNTCSQNIDIHKIGNDVEDIINSFLDKKCKIVKNVVIRKLN